MPLCVKGLRWPSSPGVRCPSGAVSWPAGLGRGRSSWPIVAVVLPRLQVVCSRCAAGAPPGPAASRRQDGSDRGMAAAPGCWAAGCGRSVVGRPGSGLPEGPPAGASRPRWSKESSPGCPPGPREARQREGIGLQAGVDGVADLPLQRPHGLFRGLAFSQFLVVIGAALAVAVADLGDRGHVDGVVQPQVPAPGQPVNLTRAGGHLDGRGAVAGGEAVPAGEPDTSLTSPITAAAMTGPTPDSVVRLVPAACTAVVSVFLVARSCASMRRRSSMNAAASSQRAASTAPAGAMNPAAGRRPPR